MNREVRVTVTTASADAAHYRAEQRTSIGAFEGAEARYSRLMDRFEERYPDQEQRDEAVSHSKAIRKAQSDAAYYRDRAIMYGLALLTARGAS